MTTRYQPINPKCPHFLHGGDYNPDQWAHSPEIWADDMRLMKACGANAMSVGIFSWTSLEPEDGRYEFGWLDRVMDMLADNDAYAVLATPSGARPAWLSRKYPEVLRVLPEGGRELHGQRHNHCPTSPVYRAKCNAMNTRLAERYKDHPALLVWHVSNEYNGQCHCDLCQDAFRQWVRRRYDDDLDKLNHAWWTAFWSHTYTDFSQVESPRPIGQRCNHGLNLAWKRFVTDQTIEFMRNEIAPLRQHAPSVPITTNFMGIFPEPNYWEMARELDVVSWDCYPLWRGDESDVATACGTAFVHDIYRSLKGGKPFMLMESVPGTTNWYPVCKLPRPGVHSLGALQAVAHGSDTVGYFQWRKSRGSIEKFHGAVVDHVGHENTRIFGEVARLGETLAKLDDVVGTTAAAEVAIIYDWENNWAIDDLAGLSRETRNYGSTCVNHYRPLWRRGIATDVIDQTCGLSKYRLVIAPMCYMLRPGFPERIEQFVAAGGTLVMTYWSGIVDEDDLCFLGGWPGGGLRKVLGIWDEEIDSLFPDDRNEIVIAAGGPLGLTGPYPTREFCSLIHAEGAEVLATYGKDFYAGRPALTVNDYGQGRAYYIASRNDKRFLDDFYNGIAGELALRRAIDAGLPEGVSAQMRTDGKREFVFLLNFTPQPQTVELGEVNYSDMLSEGTLSGPTEIGPHGVLILARCRPD